MTTTLLRHAFAATFLALLATLATAGPKTLTVVSIDSHFTDDLFNISMRVTAAGAPVPGATVTFSTSSAGNANATLLQTSAITDGNGMATVQARANDWAGSYTVNGMSGVDTASATATNRVKQFLSVLDPIYGITSIQLFTASPTCTIKSFERLPPSGAPGGLESLPPARTPPVGFVKFKLVHCDVANVGVKLFLGESLPAGREMWIYGRTIGRDDAYWHRASSEAFEGGSASFSLNDRTDGDDDRLDNDEISVPLAAVLSPVANGFPQVQDIWWSGAVENGWGMSIVQHGGVLFVVIYAYDNAGKPTWFVMPGGTWNAARTAYSGSVYTPRGSPADSYDVNQFVVGAPIGNVTLTFADGSNGTLAYTINGLSGTKTITRQLYATPAIPTLNGLTDMWWGGLAQNGWGIAVIQQSAQLFIVWFTYDQAGKATWYVMPAGSWTTFDSWGGRIYQTTGSPWVGVPYNPALLDVIDVGGFTLQVTGATATFKWSISGKNITYNLSRQPF